MTIRKPLARGLVAVALLGFAGALRADDEYQKIIYWRVGDAAPPIELKDDRGDLWKSSRHYGPKYVVVYFYLGDFMKDCTRQAIGYRDRYLDAIVLIESFLIMIVAFVPALAAALLVYAQVRRETLLPLSLSAAELGTVFAITLAMAAISAFLSLSGLRRADPAEVF